jgi:folate-binding protein YgfZ
MTPTLSPADDAAYRAARSSAVVFELPRSIVELTGPDAATFLHNLCTNDVKALAVGGGCEAFLTNHTARVVAHVAVVRLADATYRLDAVPGQAETILAHLGRYLISEQVELADRTSDFAVLGVVGPQASNLVARALEAALPNLAPWHHATITAQGREIGVRHHTALALPGYDLFVPVAAAAFLRERLTQAGAVAGGLPAYELLRVEAGFPAFGSDIDSHRFVVEVGRADAISYSKGCYLGQEPIVMARDRGHVNRLFLGVRAGPGPVLPKDSKLLQGDADSGQTTSSVFSPTLGEVIALAYIRRGMQESGTTLTVAENPGRSVVVCSLPFVPA